MRTLLIPALSISAACFAVNAAAATADPVSAPMVAIEHPNASATLFSCGATHLSVLDGSTGTSRKSIAIRCGRGGVSRTANGLAIGGEDDTGAALWLGSVDGGIDARIALMAGPVGRPAVSHDGSTIVAVGGDGTAVFVDASTGAVRRTLEHASAPVTDVREAHRGRQGSWCRVATESVWVVTDGQTMRAYDGSGALVSKYGAAASFTVGTRPTCFDVDGDGVDEVLIPIGSAISVVSADGTIRTTYSMPGASAIDAPIVAMHTDTGARIVGVNLQGWVGVIDAAGKPIAGFPRRIDAAVRAEPLLADIDGAFGIDVVLIDAAGRMSAFGLEDGSVARDATVTTHAPWYAASPAIADLRGDGMPRWVAYDGDDHVAFFDLAPSALGAHAVVWPGAGSTIDGWQKAPVAAPLPRPQAPTNAPAIIAPVAPTPDVLPSSGCSSSGRGTDVSWFVWTIILPLLAMRSRRTARSNAT